MRHNDADEGARFLKDRGARNPLPSRRVARRRRTHLNNGASSPLSDCDQVGAAKDFTGDLTGVVCSGRRSARRVEKFGVRKPERLRLQIGATR